MIQTRLVRGWVLAVALAVPGAGAEEPKPPQAPEPKRFRDEVEVVAEAPSGVEAPAELPVRPAVVTAVAGAADNVFRTLQTLPGIAATSEFDSRLSVRGGSPDENLTIMDGVEIHNPYRLLGLTSAFNPELVRSFDLYAGAFSARYGDRLSSLLVVENRPGSTQRSFSGSAALSLRIEGYWKSFDDLIAGRLETATERLARLARYDFPPELASSIPSEAIITSFPENAASGRSWGFDVFVQKRPAPGARLTGWASYTWGRAQRDEYGRSLPFEYDRRHAATLVASWRFSPRWELGATIRAFSGFPRTPVLGLRVSADETPDGRLVPALDAEGRYVYETDLGGVSNLSSARLPAFFRLDLRLSWKPGGDTGRWLVYLDVINATNRTNAGQIDARLAYDSASATDQPRLLLEPAAAIPLLPSVGVRFRF